MEKLNLTLQKHTFTNQKKASTTTQNKHKKLKPGLVASYDIWPGNGEGLFWFRHFINLSLTYLYTFTHLLTARDPHGPITDVIRCLGFGQENAVTYDTVEMGTGQSGWSGAHLDGQCVCLC